MALLQPAPEVYNLFDDIMLLAEGHIVYYGPKEEVQNVLARELLSSLLSCNPRGPLFYNVWPLLHRMTSRQRLTARTRLGPGW